MDRTLFDSQPPASASADPETSRAAEARHTASGRREAHVVIVVALVCLHPGCTATELHWEHGGGGLDRHEVSRRLADAKNRGLVRQGEQRRCAVRGTRMVTWWVL